MGPIRSSCVPTNLNLFRHTIFMLQRRKKSKIIFSTKFFLIKFFFCNKKVFEPNVFLLRFQQKRLFQKYFCHQIFLVNFFCHNSCLLQNLYCLIFVVLFFKLKYFITFVTLFFLHYFCCI